MQNPNVEWTLEIGPLNPKAQKKSGTKGKPKEIVHSMGKLQIMEHLSQALSDITKVCEGREPKFSRKHEPLRIIRRPGKTNILRLRFFIDARASITKLARKPGFARLRSLHDYSL